MWAHTTAYHITGHKSAMEQVLICMTTDKLLQKTVIVLQYIKNYSFIATNKKINILLELVEEKLLVSLSVASAAIEGTG